MNDSELVTCDDGDHCSLGQGRLAAHSTRLDTALQTRLVKSRAGEPLSVLAPTRSLVIVIWGNK